MIQGLHTLGGSKFISRDFGLSEASLCALRPQIPRSSPIRSPSFRFSWGLHYTGMIDDIIDHWGLIQSAASPLPGGGGGTGSANPLITQLLLLASSPILRLTLGAFLKSPH